MGACGSKSAANVYDDPASKEKSDSIERQLKNDEKNSRKDLKLLLLGAGESGKSTVVKQFRLIYGSPFSDSERESFKEVVIANTVQSMAVVIDAMATLHISYANPESEEHATTVKRANGILWPMPPALATALKALWQDAGVKECVTKSSSFQLNDSADYYFEALDRLSQQTYTPDDQDILRSRVKTTGITESVFQVKDFNYRVIDVGGQRSERRKWVHCFEGVQVLLFLVAISEYDQVLYEDESVSRMQESAELFDSVTNSRWFSKSCIILFLNKIDLFEEKLKTSPLSASIEQYTGPNEFHPASRFIRSKFKALHRREDEQGELYTHFTCATDSKQIKFVLAACNDTILQQNLARIGLL